MKHSSIGSAASSRAESGALIAGLAAMVTIVALLLSPLIVNGYFDGDWVLMIALIVAFIAYCPAHLSRGIASGNSRFHAYAIVMGADGAVRILFCAALAIFSVKTMEQVVRDLEIAGR